MVKPKPLAVQPPILVATLGGAVGVLLLTALLHLAPAAGATAIDYSQLIGGIFVAGPEAASWLGFAIFFIIGWAVLPPLVAVSWARLPGDSFRFTGALQKGLLWGTGLWAAAGLLLPLLGALTRVEALANPGFFGLTAGAGAAIVFLVGHLAYGIAVAVIAAMARGISPIESLGVQGYRMTGGLVQEPRTGAPAEST